jgi:hypothetical protein
MKRIILSLVLVLAFGQAVIAQDLNKLMTELAKMEGVTHQIVDRSMLDTAMAGEMQADSTGAASTKMPGFMKKLELVEVVSAENVQPELKNRFLEELSKFEDGSGYETLLTVKEGEDNVRILAQRENGVVTAVIIFAIDEEDTAIVKIVGKFDQSDLTDILNEQGKNMNK